MGWFNEYNEANDPMDNPKYEFEYRNEQEKYFEYIDDKKRWSE